MAVLMEEYSWASTELAATVLAWFCQGNVFLIPSCTLHIRLQDAKEQKTAGHIFSK